MEKVILEDCGGFLRHAIEGRDPRGLVYIMRGSDIGKDVRMDYEGLGRRSLVGQAFAS